MFWIWAGFLAFVFGMLALDLGVFHRKTHVIGVREALKWSALWIALGLLFSLFVYFAYEGHWLGLGLSPDPVDGLVNGGHHAAIKYLTGYVVEKSLSVDNIFVIAMIFASFGVPAMYQHRVLFWGVLGALVLRGVMIGVGAALVARFHWILLVFGGFLVLTGLKMLVAKDGHRDPGDHPLVRFTRRFFPVTRGYHGQHFLVRAGSVASHEAPVPGAAEVADPVVDGAKAGRWLLTPLALALVVIETSDVVFAVDSIPAIFAITGDPFLVFTSNVFAILGLRSLYFALAGMIDKFRFLKPALAVVLLVVGFKMLLVDKLKAVLGEHFNLMLLGVVLLVLVIGVVASLLFPARHPAAEAPHGQDG